MAFADLPGQAPKPKPDVKVREKDYTSPVVDTRNNHYDTLSTYATGSKWPATLLLQIGTRNQAPKATIDSDIEIYNQLRRINNFELLVTSEISPQQQQNATRNFMVQGTASVYSVVTPNEGDFFLADVGSGRTGLFTLTQVTLAAPYAESMSIVEFRQVGLVTEEQLRRIDNFVVEDLYFNRELMRNGTQPLVQLSDQALLNEASRLWRQLQLAYFQEFWDREYRTILLPNQPITTYDPYLAKFIKRTFSPDVVTKLMHMRLLSVDHLPPYTVRSLWDGLEVLEEALIWDVGQLSGLACRKEFYVHPWFHSAFNSGVDALVTLIDLPYTNDTYDWEYAEGGQISHGGYRRHDIDNILSVLPQGCSEATPLTQGLVTPVLADNYYVLSEAFYKDTAGQSTLEQLVYNVLRHEPMDLTKLITLAKEVRQFDNLERFYLMPIVIALLKVAPGAI